MKVFWAALVVLTLADYGMYLSTDYDCRHTRLGFLFPAVGGFAAFFHCEGKAK